MGDPPPRGIRIRWHSTPAVAKLRAVCSSALTAYDAAEYLPCAGRVRVASRQDYAARPRGADDVTAGHGQRATCTMQRWEHLKRRIRGLIRPFMATTTYRILQRVVGVAVVALRGPQAPGWATPAADKIESESWNQSCRGPRCTWPLPTVYLGNESYGPQMLHVFRDTSRPGRFVLWRVVDRDGSDTCTSHIHTCITAHTIAMHSNALYSTLQMQSDGRLSSAVSVRV